MKKRKSLFRRMLNSLKWIVPLLVVLGLVAYAFVPKPVEVDIGMAERGSMVLTVEEDGETRVRERYTISSPLAGLQSRIGLEKGDVVNQDDVLTTIEPAPPTLLDRRGRAQSEAAVKAAEAAVANAIARLEARAAEEAQLEKAYRRNRVLHEKGNVADADFEKAEGAYLTAKHGREAAESEVAIARFELEQSEAALRQFDGADTEVSDESTPFPIRSPIDGRVLRIDERSSRPVQPGTPLLEIGDPADLEMRVDVLSQDAVRIAPNQRVLIDHWGGDDLLQGRVRRVEPSGYEEISALGVSEQRVDVIVDFESPAEGTPKLGDGYRVEASIVVWETPDALKVPAGALFREQDRWAVFLVEDGSARLAMIEVDHNNGEFAEVLSGLDAGDRVILHPGDSVEEGTPVQPRKR